MASSPSLRVLDGTLAVARLDAGDRIPEWLPTSGFVATTRTTRELSIVCDARNIPATVRTEPGWRALEVAGPLDFALTGVLASLAGPLAQAGIPIFAISTFDTDYILVKSDTLDRAIAALEDARHTIEGPHGSRPSKRMRP